MDTSEADQIVKLFTTIDTSVDIDEANLTPIQEFYRNSTVFVTGGTGFLGQILLEKLLRSCPVSKIFVLIRNKKGKKLETRLNDIFDDPLFQRINNQFPETLKKIVPVEGDCMLPDLGLSDQDKKLLIDEVEIVFHVAATVRFDEKIRTAVFINIRAARDLLRLAQRMPKLKSFVHVSTAYSNCIKKVVEEDIYPPAASYKGVIAMVENMPDNILDKITPRIIGSYPNTYTFTKQIAEDVIKQEGRQMPIGIQRPAIVISTYREPIRAWINNIYGATGVAVGTGIGLLRVLRCDPAYNANIVPADMCVNSLIASAWDVAENFKKAEAEKSSFDIPVYNFENSNDKPIDWRRFMEITSKYGVLNPSVKCLWYYFLYLANNNYMGTILTFFLHTLPALVADGVLLCLGKPMMMTKAYKKIHKFSKAIAFFCSNEWIINSKNVQKLVGKMTQRDRKIFFSDLKQLNWEEFFKCYILGARIYIVKDPLDTLPEAKKHYKRLYWIHQAVKAILCTLLLWATWSLISLFINKLFIFMITQN